MKNDNTWHSWLLEHSWQIISIGVVFIATITFLQANVSSNERRIMALENQLDNVATKQDVARMEKQLDAIDAKVDRIIERQIVQ